MRDSLNRDGIISRDRRDTFLDKALELAKHRPEWSAADIVAAAEHFRWYALEFEPVTAGSAAQQAYAGPASGR